MGVTSDAYIGWGYVFTKGDKLLDALKIKEELPDPDVIAEALSEKSGLNLGCCDMSDPYSYANNPPMYFVYLDAHFAGSSYGYDVLKDSIMKVKKADTEAFIDFIKKEKLVKLADKGTPGWILYGQKG